MPRSRGRYGALTVQTRFIPFDGSPDVRSAQRKRICLPKAGNVATPMSRRGMLALLAAGSLGLVKPKCAGGTTAEASIRLIPYLDDAVMTKLPFGTHSHYLQPWRGYVSTIDATTFLNGIGIVLNGNAPTDHALDLLEHCGFSSARIEIAWNLLDFHNERQLFQGGGLRQTLALCHARGIRPLVLLNANHGLPTPALQFSRKVTSDAPAGARTVELESVDGIVEGFTGLSDLTETWAAEALILGNRGTQVHLSKPLPHALRAGQIVRLATLKYRPFGAADSADTRATLAGWTNYVDVVARIATDALGTRDAQDKGFDLEIWNELSFGSKFLSLNNYYDPPLAHYDSDAIWSSIVSQTVAATTSHPTQFTGVSLVNGFASTVPWPASSKQPARISGLSKHPYPRQLTFPSDDQSNGARVDARGRPTDFVPEYTAYFPEYFATAIQTESVVRDMGPTTSDIQGTAHGCYARRVDGTVRPVSVWITEIGVNPREAGVNGREAAERLKAKAAARMLLFYLNKGARRVYLYSAFGGDAGYGLVPDSYSGSPESAKDAYCLEVIRRIAKVIADDAEPDPADTRTLRFSVAPNPNSAEQFAGSARDNAPPVRNIDMLALLPFQGREDRFIVAYYFMTRDIRDTAAAEDVTIEIAGIGGAHLALTSYDPLTDVWHGVPVDEVGEDHLRTTLSVVDTPRLLVIRN
jgi:hypothetical protein